MVWTHPSMPQGFEDPIADLVNDNSGTPHYYYVESIPKALNNSVTNSTL